MDGKQMKSICTDAWLRNGLSTNNALPSRS
jgi:hypothetical protein